jgi:polyisoprenoid-binding protein YceI
MPSSTTYVERADIGESGPGAATSIPLIPDGTWTLDAARSEVGFAVRELRVIRVRGRFSDVTGRLRGAGAPLPLAESTVKVASVDTGTAKRDAHLRSTDFLDAEAYPEMSLVADRAEPHRDGTYRVAAELTIKGVTRPVELTVDEYALAGDRLTLRATGRIHRYDFGVRAPMKAVEAGGFLIAREVDLDVRLEATRDR